MTNKQKQGKVGKVSNRQGGPYTPDEMALWNEILENEGRKNHLAVFTNTEIGNVKAFWQDKDGNLIKKVLDEPIPHFNKAKDIISNTFLRKKIMTEKKIPQMTQAEVEFDIEFFLEEIEKRRNVAATDYYQRNDIETETIYCANSMEYAGLAIAYALYGDWDLAKATFQTAAEYQLKPLLMAYDANSPLYIGDSITRGAQAIDVVDCFNFAMAAGDLAIAKQACALFPVQWRPRNSKPNTADDLVHALNAWFMGDKEKAARFCQKSMDVYTAKPSKKITYRSNYYTLHVALLGIIINDQEIFDTGIQKQLDICHHEARYGEWKDSVRGHFAEYALALTNLAIQAGMKQQVFDPFIPQGLVWQKPI